MTAKHELGAESLGFMGCLSEGAGVALIVDANVGAWGSKKANDR
jgi:hypothetical protein